MSGLDKDYPDKTKKPVDTSYPPYADSFPAQQHQFGPFPPIEAFYSSAKKAVQIGDARTVAAAVAAACYDAHN